MNCLFDLCIIDAIMKLEEALVIDPSRHETLWCLGNAHTSYALLTPDPEEAKVKFNYASEFFKRAVEAVSLFLKIWSCEL